MTKAERELLILIADLTYQAFANIFALRCVRFGIPKEEYLGEMNDITEQMEPGGDQSVCRIVQATPGE
jgi:hypothetical protein